MNEELKQLINSSTGNLPAKTIQLMVPQKPIKGEPVLKNKIIPPVGSFKPADAVLWTSTSKQLPNGKWTSGWVEWCKSEMPQWLTSVGYCYEISSNIISLELKNDKDAVNVYNLFCESDKDKLTTNDGFKNFLHLTKHFPWNKVAENFDCVYHPRKTHTTFMSTWDCESTVFFNSSKMKYLKAVKIDKK
jgi:hypothetical protein